MEIGAVKQAFNNELIQLKKNLNQAKTQIIHKLTRKAKQLTEKKGPDVLKEKYKRKAESAVKEVLVLKKIKARDVGRFIVTHTGKLQDYLNKPQVDNDKACARILLHKAMQEKYKFIRNRFSNIPIKDLFMSRNERLKLKKEEKLKKKEKRDRKKAKGVVNAEGDWDVEDVVKKPSKIKEDEGGEISGDEQEMSHDEEQEEPTENSELGSDDEGSIESSVEDASGEGFKISFKDQTVDESENEGSNNEVSVSEDRERVEKEFFEKPTKVESKSKKFCLDKATIKNKSNKIKVTKIPIKLNKEMPTQTIQPTIKLKEKVTKPKSDKKQKDTNKNKNLQDKIINKKFKKDSNETAEVNRKVVDPFFVTASGENYMSIVEPRPPDEIKEEHKQGNRKLRRAVMFGHAPKIKPRKQFREENNKFSRQDGYENSNKQNGFPRNENKFNQKIDNNDRFSNQFNDNRKRKFNDSSTEDSKPEKLHPSWEAKKKQSGILPFQGKKIVFDE